MKKFQMLKEETNEKIPIEMVKRMLVSRVRPITRRFHLGDITIDDVQEDELSYFIELDITDEQFDKLPMGFKRFIN